MQSAYPLRGRSSSLSSQASSNAFRESSTCLPCSAQTSFPASRLIWFWQGFQGLSCKQFTKLSKERRKKHPESKQALDEFCVSKTETISYNEDSVQFWSWTKSTLNQSTSGRNRRDFHSRNFSLACSALRSHRESFEKVLRSFIWPNQCSNVETCGRLAFLSIFSSLLVCCPPLCLTDAPASAHEIFQKEALGKVFMMDSSRIEGVNLKTQATSDASNLVWDLSLTTKATPLFSLSNNASVCEEAYGVFPCSNSLPGNLFLMLVYGYILLMAARFISEGSELLLEVMNPGLIGGLLLPVLGALPDAALICASGVGGTVEEAQQEVLVGVGVLAGSTTLILSVAWAGSLVAGRCDLTGPGHTAKDLTLTPGFDLFRTGITTDEQTRWGALIMIASGVPYICAQLPLLDKHPEQGPESALAGCVLALSGLVLYSGYQIASPWLQKKKIEEARLHYLRTSALQGISAFSENFMVPSALSFQEQAIAPSDPILQEIFASFDKNADGKIERDELRGLILGLNIDKGSFQDKEQVEKWFKEFDVNTDDMLSETEFLLGIKNWANRVAEQRKTSKFQQMKNSMLRVAPNFWGAKLEEAKQALDLLEAELEQCDEVSSDKEGESLVINASKLYQKSVVYLVSGAALAATFSDPLIDSIQGFSSASRIPPFFVAFIVVPLASNASIVYARGLTWDFSSEVTVVLLNILLVGLIGASRVTFPLWYAIPVFSLYFLSLGGVALLDNLLGWH